MSRPLSIVAYSLTGSEIRWDDIGDGRYHGESVGDPVAAGCNRDPSRGGLIYITVPRSRNSLPSPRQLLPIRANLLLGSGPLFFFFASPFLAQSLIFVRVSDQL